MTHENRTFRSRRRAFTLIEVLMAAFVIGLGVLGLAAIFAGAAFQQQISSEITASITLSRSAESSIAAQIGSLRSSCANPNPDAQFRPGRWHPITTSNLPDADPEVGMLTIDPNGQEQWFFANRPTEPMPRILYSVNQPYAGQITGGQLTQADFDNPAKVRDFGRGRILPQSCVIEVTISGFPCDVESNQRRSDNVNQWALRFTHSPTGSCPDEEDIAFFTAGASVIQVDMNKLQASGDIRAAIIQMEIAQLDEDRQLLRLFDDGQYAGCLGQPYEAFVQSADNNLSDWLVQDPAGLISQLPDPRAEIASYSVGNPFVAFQPGGSNSQIDGFIYAEVPDGPGGFSIGTQTDPGALFPIEPAGGYTWRFIDRIDLVDYRWRATDLTTLNQRLRFETDATRPGGERPSMGYSMMFRRLVGSDTTQVVLFTYAISGGSGNAEFVPPERLADFNNRLAPLRRERLRLRYDDEERAYFVTSTGDNSDWMIRSGQILLFEGSQTHAGSDAPVRIIRVRTVNGQTRGYLENAPRSAGRSLLTLPGASAGQFDVWSIQPAVRSVTDSSTWSLRPVEARVLQIVAN